MGVWEGQAQRMMHLVLIELLVAMKRMDVKMQLRL